MNNPRHLFGSRGQWLSIATYFAIILAFMQSFLAIGFILSEVFIRGESITHIGRYLLDNRHIQAVFNSFIVALLLASSLTVLSAGGALVFRRLNLTGHRLIYTASIIPIMIPDQIFGIGGRVLFDPATGLLSPHLPDTLIIERNTALLLIVIVALLKWLPPMIVITDTAISAMKRSELQQALMDFPRFRAAAIRVYLPIMRPVLLLVFCLGFLLGFRVHELAYELTSSGGGFAAEMWSLWNYKVLYGFDNGFFRAATEAFAVLILLLIPIMAIRRQAIIGIK